MELLFWLFVMGAIFVGAAVQGQRQADRYQKVFADFAGRHQGRLVGAVTWLDPHPVVETHYAGLPVRVEQTSTGGKHPVFFVEVTLHIERENPQGWRVEAYPEGMLSSLGKLVGMQDIEVGDPWFDDRFVLQGNSAERVRSYFDVQTRRYVHELYGLFGTFDVQVHLDRRHLKIKKRHRAGSPEDLELIYRPCLHLFARALRVLGSGRYLPPDDPAAEGIHFLPREEEGVTVLAGRDEIRFLTDDAGKPVAVVEEEVSVCQVCGEDVGEREVRCAWCRTPHHRDCWDYNERCSTFGCESRRAVGE